MRRWIDRLPWWGAIAFLADPEGHRVGLMQYD